MRGKAIDLTGQKFGRLTVQARVPNRSGYWACTCECGNTAEVYTTALTTTHATKSCGCLLTEHAKQISLKARGKEFEAYGGRRPCVRRYHNRACYLANHTKTSRAEQIGQADTESKIRRNASTAADTVYLVNDEQGKRLENGRGDR